MATGRVRTSVDATTLRWARIGALLGAVVVGLVGLALLTVLAGEPTFSSEATIAIDQVERIAAAESPDIIDKLSRLRLKYAGLVTTRAVAGPVAEEVDRDEDLVAGSLYSYLYPDSLLLAVGARHRDPAAAEEMARAAADFVVEMAAEEQEEAGVDDADRFELTVVTPAREGARVDQPQQRAGVVALGLGLVLLLACIPLFLTKPR
jgi:capsular polysaccharide biosynthesis protein